MLTQKVVFAFPVPSIDDREHSLWKRFSQKLNENPYTNTGASAENHRVKSGTLVKSLRAFAMKTQRTNVRERTQIEGEDDPHDENITCSRQDIKPTLKATPTAPAGMKRTRAIFRKPLRA